MKLATYRSDRGNQAELLQKLESRGAWWTRFGDEMLVYSANAKWRRTTSLLSSYNLDVDEKAITVNKTDLFLVVQKGRLFQQAYPDVDVLVDKGRYLAVRLDAKVVAEIERLPEPCFNITPLPTNTVIFNVHPPLVAERAARVAWIQSLVNTINRYEFESTLTHLTSYLTRHSTSTQYASALDWCRSVLDTLGYATRTEQVTVGSSSSKNLIADKQGSGTMPRNLVLVVAHLDSINSAGGATANAPGADDNGSGSAGLLELARVLSGHDAVHDLRLILFGGEEQGLLGSTQFVASLPAPDQARIVAVVNMDMIGTLNTTTPTVLLEGASVSQSVINDLVTLAATYTSLTSQTSLYPYASDHVPFISAGMPAVLTIEGADSANSNIHTANDTLTHIDYDLALEILCMNVAYIAKQIGNHTGGNSVIEIPEKFLIDYIVNHWETILKYIRTQYSGRYPYNSGPIISSVTEVMVLPGPLSSFNVEDRIHAFNEPIYKPELISSSWWNRLWFTLHIDIDGTDPLGVVSGTIGKGWLSILTNAPTHFIGRVTSNVGIYGGRRLVVTDFSFNWPGSSDVIDKLEIDVRGPLFGTPTAEVVFVDTARNHQHGPYSVDRESRYFRDAEFELDREDNAVDVEPYNSRTHPDRPSDLPETDLTIKNAFAKSGINVTFSSSGNVIDTTEAGADSRWNYQELHDAMDDHWSAFANKPQWKMWLFLAELATSDDLGGVMFDGDIDEPGGVDRQGTAVFTKSPHFHTINGDYIKANPPEAEAVQRELFFNTIHESGHAFNLYHSFSKLSGTPWQAPTWMPVQEDDEALSWMNYPEAPSPGYNATWFYDRFRFRFDDNENLFLRHAPARFVQMGNEAWRQNHGRVARSTLDRRLSLVVRTQKSIFTLGEPINVELRLRNISNQAVMAHRNLDPSDGFVEIGIITPSGQRMPFVPFIQTRLAVDQGILEPNDSVYQTVNLTIGKLGFPFKTPGVYRIEASYHNVDGGTATAVMNLWVKPPEDYSLMPVISELFHARVGRVLSVGGTRAMEDVNDKLDWICEQLENQDPLCLQLSAIRAMPYAYPFKWLSATSDRIEKLDPEPEIVIRHLTPAIENLQVAANAFGNILYRRVVDTFTRSALDDGRKDLARRAQADLHKMFKQRGVIDSVLREIKAREKELK